MKILHVGPLKGGIDAYFRIILSHIGCDFDFVAVRGADDGDRPYVRNGQEIKTYRIVTHRALNPLRDVWALLQVIWIIRKEHPDLIHCHSAKGGVIGRMAAFLTGKKCVYTPHAFSFFAAKSERMKRLYLWIERHTKFHSCLIACSKTERMLAIRQVDYPEKKVFLWNNSIPDVNVDMIEYPNRLADDEQYIVTIARPSYQKNTLMMVEIMNKVHKVLPRLKFYLLGAGDNVYAPLQDEMKELIRKYGLESVCKLLPWLPHKDALGYLKYAQLYLTTSLYEGLPIAVLEAMALGKAIVASDVVGNRDCVQNGVNGMLIPMESSSFADTICELLKDEDRRALMGKNARKLFETEFMVEQRIQQLESIYTKVYNA